MFVANSDGILSSINPELKQLLKEASIIPKDMQIEWADPVGCGHFGAVYLGKLSHGQKSATVAIKTLKG